MARTIADIQDVLIQAKESDTRLNGLTSTSKVSIWRLFLYAVAVAMNTLEVLFDLHSNEVDTKLAELKPHTLRYYRNFALAFQWGHDLVEDTPVYDNTNYTDDQIEDSRIIKYAAATEADSRVIIKIATENGGKLQPITVEQRNAFAAYMTEGKDAGVPVTVINYLPDRLYLSLRIYYDPLVLDSTGASILNGGKPVETAIEQYMKALPFNGELVLAHLVDVIQKVPGVAIPDLQFAQTSWIDANLNDYGPVQAIDVKKIPESGYFEVVNFDNVTYLSNV